MASDLNKHKAEILKIAGFALFTPAGRIFIEPIIVFNEFEPVWFVFYCLIVFYLTATGFIFILRSYDMLREVRGIKNERND